MSGPRGRSLPRRGVGSALLALGVLLGVGAACGAAPSPAAAPAMAATPAPPVASPKPKPVAPIDINSASLAQLKTLQGIGDAEARRIIAHRPYLSKADLVTKNVIPAGVYQSNRHRIIAVQPETPRPSKHS